MLRRLLPTFVALSALLVAFGVPGVGASTGTLTLDFKTGTATWSTVVLCQPGDDVEIDVFVTQGSGDASTEAFFPCPSDGEEEVFASTIGEENDRLHPGRAELHVVRTDYDIDENDELLAVNTTETRAQVTLRPQGS